ncbi:MAG: type II toxin-antitoxin system HicA family toxin [Candidatus Pacebacteria bacterium]|nr:type II toxin-antitoxin system HicA family toxin [Candidatus Paceibacterota bacterium]
MPKLRNLSGKKLVSIFESFGFAVLSQKGSHIKMFRFNLGEKQILVIPNHLSIAKGTLKAIYNQAVQYIAEEKIKKRFLFLNP